MNNGIDKEKYQVNLHQINEINNKEVNNTNEKLINLMPGIFDSNNITQDIKKQFKVALITGGTRGIGGAITQLFKNNGYIVIANYRNNDKEAEEFETRANFIENKSNLTGYIKIKKWDVTDFAACKYNVDLLLKEYGKIDVLVNNAGITRDKMMHKMSEIEWLDVIKTNLTSCFNMSSAVINNMRENNYGRIINIASVNAQIGQVGQTNYSASKAGIIGFTKSLAKESASKGITVNCIAPGYVNTEMTAIMPNDIKKKIIEQIPMGRFANTEEIANAILFLTSEYSSFITGSVLNINGGMYM
ncbi:MAG: beta-ketoacyl-ACP reductase [Rickettsiales bacterium]